MRKKQNLSSLAQEIIATSSLLELNQEEERAIYGGNDTSPVHGNHDHIVAKCFAGIFGALTIGLLAIAGKEYYSYKKERHNHDPDMHEECGCRLIGIQCLFGLSTVPALGMLACLVPALGGAEWDKQSLEKDLATQKAWLEETYAREKRIKNNIAKLEKALSEWSA